MEETNTLFVFIDESGNLDFGAKGTANYVLAAVSTINPVLSANVLQRLKYMYLREGDDIEFFHASENKQKIRNEVLSRISALSDVIRVHYIHARKDKVYPNLQKSAAFYALLGAELAKHILGHNSEGYSQVVIIFDKCLRGKEQKAFLKEVKPKLKMLDKPYRIFFHRTLSDFNGQIADYFAWSKYVSLERKEFRPLSAVKGVKQTDYSLFE